MLQWNVYIEDINSGRIEVYNIFSHSMFRHACLDALSDFSEDREALSKRVRGALQYYFWSKCEWETVVVSLIPTARSVPRKIDVCEQVVLNWEAFLLYLFEHKNELNGQV